MRESIGSFIFFSLDETTFLFLILAQSAIKVLSAQCAFHVITSPRHRRIRQCLLLYRFSSCLHIDIIPDEQYSV